MEIQNEKTELLAHQEITYADTKALVNASLKHAYKTQKLESIDCDISTGRTIITIKFEPATT